MAKRTITVKLDDNTKDFYRNMFLARKLQRWVEMYKALHGFMFDDDVDALSDEDIIESLSNKETAKQHLSASAYEEYLQYYDEIWTKE